VAKQVVVHLGADTAGFQSQMMAASTTMQRASQKITSSLTNIAMKGAIIGTVVGGSIAVASNEAAKLEKQIRETGSLMDDFTQNDIIPMKEEIQELGTTFAQNFSDVAEGQYQITSAGFNDIAESAKVAKAAAMGAAAGVSDMSQTTKVVTKALNAFDVSADKAKDVMNIFNMGVKQGQIRMEDFADSMGRANVAAVNMGVGMGEMVSSISRLTKVGMSSNEAITNFAAMLAKMSKETKGAQKALDILGVKGTSQKQKFQNLIAQSDNFAQALIKIRKVIDETPSLNVTDVFTRRQARRGFLGLTQNAEKLNKLIGDMNNRGQFLLEKIRDMRDSAAFKGKQTWLEFKAILQDIGFNLLEKVKEQLDIIRVMLKEEGPNIVKDISDMLSGALEMVINNLGTIISAIRTLMTIGIAVFIAKLAGSFIKLASGIGLAVKAAWRIVAALNATAGTFAAILGGIGLLTGAIVVVIGLMAAWKGKFSEFISMIKTIINTFYVEIQKIIYIIMQGFFEIMKAIRWFVNQGVDAINEFGIRVGEVFKNIYIKAKKWFAGILGYFKEMASQIKLIIENPDADWDKLLHPSAAERAAKKAREGVETEFELFSDEKIQKMVNQMGGKDISMEWLDKYEKYLNKAFDEIQKKSKNLNKKIEQIPSQFTDIVFGESEGMNIENMKKKMDKFLDQDLNKITNKYKKKIKEWREEMGIEDGKGGMGEALTTFQKGVRSTAGMFQQRFSSALTQMVDDSKSAFVAIRDAFTGMLTQMLAEFTSKAAIFGLVNLITGGSAGTILGAAGESTGLFEYIFGAFDSGGTLPSERMGLVGEQSPELIRPKQDSRIVNTRNLEKTIQNVQEQEVTQTSSGNTLQVNYSPSVSAMDSRDVEEFFRKDGRRGLVESINDAIRKSQIKVE